MDAEHKVAERKATKFVLSETDRLRVGDGGRNIA